ncbi:MAG: AMP-binding protein [Clostridiales bacterium]|nr:AMP-binding protein [Clostridiales bacterium]
MEETTGLDLTIKEIASRIRELRLIESISEEEMAEKVGLDLAAYRACESGEQNLNFAFLYRCALAFGVDVTDIIQGSSPTLSSYALTRSGEGQRIEKAHGMTYHNMAAAYKNRIAEPLYVRAEYSASAQHEEIPLTAHEGQEFDLVIRGHLKVQVGSHTEILNEGDTIYYDSSTPHGMIAVGGQDCEFYAIVLNPAEHAAHLGDEALLPKEEKEAADDQHRVYENFIDVEENADGSPKSITYHNEDKFNFGFDVVDEIAKKDLDKLAFLHVAADHTERRFTFRQVMQESNRAANYFRSIGIKKGDRVLLILKRHYQFWFIMPALNKIGAVAALGSNQLLEHDLTYRFDAAGISAVLCTGDGDVAHQVDLAAAQYQGDLTKIMVGNTREGWRSFDEEYRVYSSHYERPADAPCGEDYMLMFFTSGTTGYPKIAAHNYKYALGHFYTAKYWHRVDPNGLHLTISDTGWAKSMWGKLYGQWLCEAPLFIYDFERFHAADILPMFAKYHITTFCAPPTMLRMMIKEDLSKYDFSSVKHMTTAGEALNPEVFRQFKKLTGLTIMEGFGQSEGTVLIANSYGMTPRIGSMGKPIVAYDIDIYDADGKPSPVGQTGEICINMKNGHPCGLLKEYYKAPEKTEEVFRGGLYHTGDTAYKDEDGYYWYVGRVDDVIKSSGYRIGPFEIENVIMELPYVLECGVSGTPDEIRGQVVKASIVLTKGTEPTEELKKEIQDYVKKHTAPYKYPRIVVFKEELPKTVSGKIMRNKL